MQLISFVVRDPTLALTVAGTVSVVVAGVGDAALIYASATAHSGGQPSVIQSYRFVIGKFMTLLELTLRTFGAFILLALTILGIPLAIRLLVRWFFGTYAVVLRDDNAKGAITHSCLLVTGRWWSVAAIVLLPVLLSGAVYVPLMIFWSPYSTFRVIAGGTFSLLWGPLAASFMTLVFLELEQSKGEPSPLTASFDLHDIAVES